ncbi:MAG TPA: hypothetical protein VF623_09705 [Segetibacter sp.]
MKLNFTFLYFLLFFSLAAGAQNMTGIWKGYFVQNSFGIYEDRYKFEVQVEQLPNSALNGVTYSYKTTVFYGKAEAKGIYTKKTRNIVIDELKLVDLKIGDKSQPCLMTCYLEYTKMGSLETLTGTYASRNLKDKDDCGNGKVYLERATTSDFYKEEFLVKREALLKKKTKVTPNRSTLPKTTAKVTTVQKKPILKPGAEQNVVAKTTPKRIDPAPGTPVIITPKKEVPATTPPPPVAKVLPKPEVIRNRNNELAKAIQTSAKEFKIELYDNGEIDGDRISVYDNNKLIVSNQLLTNKPITITINADESTRTHEFVMVAENLGSIPPNTALMIVTAGGQRYELFLTSTEQKNAVVRVEFKAE